MAVSFARQTKLSNVSGRANYISNPTRQDNIVLHSTEHMQNSWNDYAKYENENTKSHTENNQGREIIIHLPHDLAEDKIMLKKVVEDYSKKVLGDNRDFEYAVHWNQKESNLHAHIIFSERERNLEREPKVYKRNIWLNKDTGKMAKANSENAILKHKKGDIQRDKETGEIKYNDDPFSIKDKRFITKRFNEEIKEIHKEVMNEHGFNFRLFDPDKEVAQKHLGNKHEHQPEYFIEENNMTGEVMKKDNPNFYRAIEIEDYNEKVKGLNQYLEQAKMTVKDYMERFKELFAHMKKPKVESQVEKLKKEINELENEKSLVEQEIRKHDKICLPHERNLDSLERLKNQEINLINKKVGMLDFKGQTKQREDLEYTREKISEFENHIEKNEPKYQKAKSMIKALEEESKTISSKIDNRSKNMKSFARANNLDKETKEVAKGYNKGFNKGDIEQWQENIDRKKAEEQKRERQQGRSRGR